jgi:putative SOS response-associated peptidase YedK
MGMSYWFRPYDPPPARPVILHQSGFAAWLDKGDVAPAADLDEQMQLFAVSPKVNSPKYDAEDCIAPLIGKP